MSANDSARYEVSGSAVAEIGGDRTDLTTFKNTQDVLRVGHKDRLQLKRSSSHDGTKAFQKPNLVSSVSETSAKLQRPTPKLQRTASGTPMSLGWASLQSEHAKLPFSLQELMTSSISNAGYFANRRNVMHCNQDRYGMNDDDNDDDDDQCQSSVNKQSNTLSQAHNKSSLIRLSMTSNGRAKVVTETDLSPPKKLPVPIDIDPFSSSELRNYENIGSNVVGDKALFKRGCTSATTTTTTNATSLTARKTANNVPILTSGRSRDSRAWEFWCDADARNSLSQKADKERSGSAANAIGLMRSSSKAELRRKAGGCSSSGKRNRAVLADVSSKRQKSFAATTATQGNDGIVGRYNKGLAREHRLSRLKRNASAYGRMQSKYGTEMGEKMGDGKGMKMAVKPVVAVKEYRCGRGKGEEDDDEFEVPQTESDKENWDPEVSGSRVSKMTRVAEAPKLKVQPSGCFAADKRLCLGLKERILSSSSSSDGHLMRKHADRRHRQKVMRRLHDGGGGGSGGDSGAKGEEEDIEDVEEEDPEIARFMSGAGDGDDNGEGGGGGCYSGEAKTSRTTVAAATAASAASAVAAATVEEEEDMHCVESLLSLSRGTWVASA